MPLAAGTHFAERFQIERPAGQGGMGTVYRAVDGQTGRVVALKLIQPGDAQQDVERFLREAQILAALRHPGIVQYITHGIAEPGLPYLAMEWLEGEDLAQRLRRGRPSIAELGRMLARVGQALSVAHERGVVHRDIKPSNLFLRGGKIEDVVLLDFGIARQGALPRAMTRTGVVLGTPEYMAPEQARGERTLGPSADIFALGCVAYECLLGQPPFVADHLTAVLAKFLFEEAPRVSTRLPDIPAELDDLVAQMLAKEPARRPRDAHAFLALLARLGELGGEGAPASTARTLPIAAAGVETRPNEAEQHLVCVLLATPSPQEPGADDPAAAAASTDELRPILVSSSQSLVPVTSRLDELKTALSEHDVVVEQLADGSLVVTLDSSRSTVLHAATDLAAQAARCALLVRRLWPEASVALATGRGRLSERIPVGEALDRAGSLLQASERGSTTGRSSRPPVAPIVLDEVTAGLLPSRFRADRRPDGLFELRGEDLASDAGRLLLGKPTPCVGREHELGILDGALSSCIDEGAPRAVLITAPPGGGKSRLRHEFLLRVEAREAPVTVLLGRGDPMSTAWSHELLGQAVRQLCGVRERDGLPQQRESLRAYLSQRLPKEEVARAAEFLGELCSVPFPDERSPTLHAARQDPALMGSSIRQALLGLLRAETALQPVVLVLEDLHWGDALTVKLIDAALRELASSPLFVLGLARPEVEERFPKIWSSALLSIPLRPLSKKSSERLVMEVLGRSVPAETVRRIVEQAGGNALFLEELMRSIAEGKGDELPPTLLAMLQVRIGRLSPAARRVLMAGSIFGDSFRPEGLVALLGVTLAAALVGKHLADLESAELLTRTAADPDGTRAYQFRHVLLREATYQLVPIEDKITLHKLAAAYLEKGAGSHLHYQTALDLISVLPVTVETRRQRIELLFERTRAARGKEPPDVSVQRLHEAESGLKQLLAEGHTSAASQKLLRFIQLWLGQMYYLANKQLQAVRFFQEILKHERDDHQLITLPISILGQSLAVQGRFPAAIEHLAKLLPIFEAGAREQDVVSGLSFLCIALAARGDYERAVEISARVVQGAQETDNQTLIAAARGPRTVVFLFGGDNAAALAEASAAAIAAERAGSALYLYLIFALRAWAESRSGQHAEAEESLARCQAMGQRLGSRLLIADWVAGIRAELALNRGDPAAARALGGGALALAQSSRSLFATALAQRVIALSQLAEGRLDEAEHALRSSLESFELGGAVIEAIATQKALEQVRARRAGR
jgi:serine/threonine protein kinase/predicted ATPase